MTKISDDKLNNKMTELANAMRTRFNKTNKMSVRDMIQTLAIPAARPNINISNYKTTLNLGSGASISANLNDSLNWPNDTCVIHREKDNSGCEYNFVSNSYFSVPAAYTLKANYDIVPTALVPLHTISGDSSNPIPSYTGGSSGNYYAWVDSISASNGIGKIVGWHCSGGNAYTAKYHWVILVVDGQEVCRFTTQMAESNDVYNVHKDVRTSNFCRFEATFPIGDSRLYTRPIMACLRYSDQRGDYSYGGDYYTNGKNNRQSFLTMKSSDKKLYSYPSDINLGINVSLSSDHSISFQKNLVLNAQSARQLNSWLPAGKEISGSYSVDTFALSSGEYDSLDGLSYTADTNCLITFNTDYDYVIRIKNFSLTLEKQDITINRNGATPYSKDLISIANTSPYITDNTFMQSGLGIGYRNKDGTHEIPVNSVVLIHARLEFNRYMQEFRNFTVAFSIGNNNFNLKPSDTLYPHFDIMDNYAGIVDTVNFYGYTIITDTSQDLSSLDAWIYQDNNAISGLNQDIKFDTLRLLVLPYQDSTVDVNFNNVNSAYQKLGKAFRNHYGKSDKMTVDDMIKLLK